MKKTVLHSLTGAFVLAAFFVAAVAVISRPTLLGWFGRIRTCETWLPEAYVKKGDAVEFRSFAVGRVIGVHPHPWHTERGRDWFRVTLAIEHDWLEAVTDQFTMTVSVGPLGALTGSNLVLLAPDELVTLDAANPAVRRGRALASYDEDEIVELAFNDPVSLLDELTGRARDALDRVGPQAEELIARAGAVIDELGSEEGDLRTFVRLLRSKTEDLQGPLEDMGSILRETRMLVQSLNDPDGSLQSAFADIAAVAAAVERGEGVIGGLLRDGELEERTTEILHGTDGVLDETRTLLVQGQATMSDVNEGSRALPELVEQLVELVARAGDVVARVDTASRTLPGLAEEVRRALEQTNHVLVGLRESSLVNLFVDLTAPPPGAPLTLPAALGGGAR
jgi:ABC-type transporter Mla subunit MlaD